MLKKLIITTILTVFSFSLDFGLGNVDMSSQLSNSIKSSKLKGAKDEIKTYSDYLKFKKDIEKMIVFEPAKGYFILGTLYMKKFVFPKKTIYPNIKKSIYYLEKSLENGNDIAAYYIALLKYKKEGEIYQSLLILKNTLNKMLKKGAAKTNIYSLLAEEYASLILDTQKRDRSAIKDAMHYIEKVDYKNKIAAYLYANLLYFAGPKYTKQASMLLNYACSTTKDKELLKKCRTNPYIRGNKLKINCPIARSRGE